MLVEVKRSSDTRTRREVVAQMLEYAANGVAYWPIDRVIQAYRDTTQNSGQDPDINLAEFIGDTSTEMYWRAVEANLRSGRVRLVFVADHIPKELVRIVEFLNEQMRPAEVLAIEMEQFTSNSDKRILVPRLYGQTERAQSIKAVSEPTVRLSEADWLESLGEPQRQGCERLVKLPSFKALGCRIDTEPGSTCGVSSKWHQEYLLHEKTYEPRGNKSVLS